MFLSNRVSALIFLKRIHAVWVYYTFDHVLGSHFKSTKDTLKICFLRVAEVPHYRRTAELGLDQQMPTRTHRPAAAPALSRRRAARKPWAAAPQHYKPPNEIRELFPVKLGARGYALLGAAVSFLYIFTHLLYICCVRQPEVC